MDNNNETNKKTVVVITKQVNTSIDEEKVKEANNKIKVKEIPFFVKFLSIVFGAMIIFFASFYAIKYAKRFIKGGEVTTTKATTSSGYSRATDYWNKDTVRRYLDKDSILLFLPRSMYEYVFEIQVDEDENIITHMGTYNDTEVQLTMDDIADLRISDNGIMLDDKEYKISSGEFKYYTFKDGTSSSILVINASATALYGVFIDTNRVAYSGNYMEYDDKIVLTCDNGTITFNKNGNTVDYNGTKLTLAS